MSLFLEKKQCEPTSKKNFSKHDKNFWATIYPFFTDKRFRNANKMIPVAFPNYSPTVLQWASYQIRKIAGCACAWNAWNVFHATDLKGNLLLTSPAFITARAWRTCRDVFRDRQPAVAGKTFPAFPAHTYPQFYVSDKRPMDIGFDDCVPSVSDAVAKHISLPSVVKIRD